VTAGTAPRRDREGNEARLRCRQCEYPLARLSRDRRFGDITPGVRMMVYLAENRAELVCSRCGTRRSVMDVIFSAMAVPKLAVEAC
jgi:ribosomal protein S14